MSYAGGRQLRFPLTNHEAASKKSMLFLRKTRYQPGNTMEAEPNQFPKVTTTFDNMHTDNAGLLFKPLADPFFKILYGIVVTGKPFGYLLRAGRLRNIIAVGLGMACAHQVFNHGQVNV